MTSRTVAAVIVVLGGALLFASLFVEWYDPGADAWTAFEILDLVLAFAAEQVHVDVAGDARHVPCAAVLPERPVRPAAVGVRRGHAVVRGPQVVVGERRRVARAALPEPRAGVEDPHPAGPAVHLGEEH